MQTDELLEAVSQTALVLQQLEARAAQAGGQSEQAAATLRRTADEVQRTLQQALREAGVQIAEQGREAAKNALNQPAQAFEQSLAQVTRKLVQATEQLNVSCVAASRRVRILSAGALFCIGLTGVILAGGSGYMIKQNMQRIEQTRVQAEVLEAMQRMPLTVEVQT